MKFAVNFQVFLPGDAGPSLLWWADGDGALRGAQGQYQPQTGSPGGQ